MNGRLGLTVGCLLVSLAGCAPTFGPKAANGITFCREHELCRSCTLAGVEVILEHQLDGHADDVVTSLVRGEVHHPGTYHGAAPP